MWNVRVVPQESVVVALHPTFMACIWIRKGTHTHFSVAAYKQYVCTHFQIGRGILFNPTWIQHSVNNFLEQYSLRNAYISFMPDYTSTPHGFVASDTAYPSESFFKPYQKVHVESGFDYLYPDEEHAYIYYWYQIPRSLIMQLQCVAIAAAFNCIRITPRFCALLYAYKAMHGAAFRHSQLGLDLMRNNKKISLYFEAENVRRFVAVHDQTLVSHAASRIDIVAACGLSFLYQGL